MRISAFHQQQVSMNHISKYNCCQLALSSLSKTSRWLLKGKLYWKLQRSGETFAPAVQTAILNWRRGRCASHRTWLRGWEVTSVQSFEVRPTPSDIKSAVSHHLHITAGIPKCRFTSGRLGVLRNTSNFLKWAAKLWNTHIFILLNLYLRVSSQNRINHASRKIVLDAAPHSDSSNSHCMCSLHARLPCCLAGCTM